MTHITHRSRTWITILCLLGLLALAFTSSIALADSGCKKVSGKFTLQPVSGPECTSPIGLCAVGAYNGNLTGTSFFTGTSITTTVDTAVTGVVILTGDNAIQTGNGGLQTKDAITLNTAPSGEFAEIDTVIAGSGGWAGASGTLQAIGTFTASGGEGSYSGTICTP